MSRLKQGYLDLISACEGILTTDGKNRKVFKYVNIFDDQIDEMIKSKSYDFALPSVFIQITTGESKSLGMGIRSYPDTEVRFHIISQMLNINKYMEQNTTTFDLCDIISRKFNSYSSIVGFSALMEIENKQDFKHDSIYKHILGYKTNLIEIIGTVYDNPDIGTINTFEVLINHQDFIINRLPEELQGYDITYTVAEDSNTFEDNIPDGAIVRNVIYMNNGEINGWIEQGITRTGNIWDFTSIGGLLAGTIITFIYGLES